MTDHAILSASGASGWMRCYGKLAMEKGLPESSSKYADEGTAAHAVAEMCLLQEQDAAAFVGRIIVARPAVTQIIEGELVEIKPEVRVECTEEMAEAVQVYLDTVRAIPGDHVVEQKVDYSRYLFDEGQMADGMTAFGTSDFTSVIEADREIVVVDYKHGRGVAVSAEENEQEQLYALGAISAYDLVYDIEDDWTVRLMIVQPRANNISEWPTTVGALKEFALKAKLAARHAAYQYDGHAEPQLSPGEKQCRWCKAKATCPALATEVREVVGGAAASEDFADLTEEYVDVPSMARLTDASLSGAMAKVDLVEQWCKAVRAETERRLLAGVEVPGYKLVQGKRGNRAWVNPAQAEEALKAMRLKTEQMYDLKLISPTAAEKLHKAGEIGPRQWAKVKDLYAQSEGAPHVAPAHDKRPALSLSATADDFAVVSDEGSDLA